MTVRFDPHVHSAASYDADAPVDRLLDRAANAGLDALAISDHDAIEASLRAVERAPDYDLLAVPGVEVSTADGHLLALGVESRPDPGRSLPVTVDAVRSLGGLSVVPHPFQRSRHGASASAIEDAAPDAVEVHNAHTLLGVRNEQAQSFARRHSFPGIGASDAHSASLVGRGFTEVAVDANPLTTDALLDAIRAGRTTPCGRRTTTGQFLRKYLANAALLV
ncbi:CehA/McbA family metallohydrolase [Haloplanus pelagicus]|jgi:predicted metal-dependent phosphoesterase TrpH|uniref:CehA/McbA family metallohydrolase n=1 Tax=Haloplanus pelagicus TaxID=2949995 RepID=UPI00203E54A9|nr:PHP domain-containing protein [Haloplanus sp. HW8-1]